MNTVPRSLADLLSPKNTPHVRAHKTFQKVAEGKQQSRPQRALHPSPPAFCFQSWPGPSFGARCCWLAPGARA